MHCFPVCRVGKERSSLFLLMSSCMPRLLIKVKSFLDTGSGRDEVLSKVLAFDIQMVLQMSGLGFNLCI